MFPKQLQTLNPSPVSGINRILNKKEIIKRSCSIPTTNKQRDLNQISPKIKVLNSDYVLEYIQFIYFKISGKVLFDFS